MMRKLNKLFSIVFFLGVVLLLSSCQEWGMWQGDGSLVRFVGAESVLTRAHYEESDNPNDTKRLIVWDDDDIKITSNKAKTEQNSHEHTYRVKPSRISGTSSFATFLLDKENEDGLRWDSANTTENYDFWAVYPASVVLDDAGKISVKSEELQYLMVAHRNTPFIKNNTEVFLRFYPAFTGFEIGITAKDGIQITDCSLVSVSEKDLVAAFTATIKETNIDNIKCASGSKTAEYKKVSKNGNTSIFNFFCLPQAYPDNSIKVSCTFEVGDRTLTKSLLLPFSFDPYFLHKVDLTLDGIDDDDPDLTLGAGQLIFIALASNRDYFKNWLENNLKGQNNDLYNELMNLFNSSAGIISDDFLRENFSKADEFLKGLSEEQLAEIKKILSGITSIRSGDDIKMVTSDITASDFKDWLPNVESVDIGCNKSLNPSPKLEMEGLDNLHNVNLNWYKDIEISNCGGEEGIYLNIQNVNDGGAPASISLKKLKLKNTQLWLPQVPGPVTLEEVTGVTELNVQQASKVDLKSCDDLTKLSVNGDMTSLRVEKCQNFKEFTLQNTPGTFSSIDLIETPYFEKGTISGNNIESVKINLVKCSILCSSKAWIEINNTNPTVTINRDTQSTRDRIGVKVSGTEQD